MAKSEHTKWATDVTEFNVDSTKVCVLPVQDLHVYRINPAMAGRSPSVKMFTNVLRTAIQTLRTDQNPVVRSDKGFQYRRALWRDTLTDAGLTQSMSRKDTCLDNAQMEGFLSHLKAEWFRIQKPETVEAFHSGLSDYLQR